MRISDWSSDVCSSDLEHSRGVAEVPGRHRQDPGQRGDAHPESDQVRVGRRRGGDVRGHGAAVNDAMPSDALPDAEVLGGGRLVDNIMYFGPVRRAPGRPVGPGWGIESVKGVAGAGGTNSRDFYWTLKAVALNCRAARAVRG